MFLGKGFIALDEHLAGFLIHHITGHNFIHQVLIWKWNLGNICCFELPDEFEPKLPSLLGQNLAAFRITDINGRSGAYQKVLIQRLCHPFLFEVDTLGPVKIVQQLISAVAQGLEQDGDRKLTPSINTYVEDVFGVEFQIDPRAPQRNYSG